MPRYTLESGRRIDRDGKPFVTIHGIGTPYFGDPAEHDSPAYNPVHADEFAQEAAAALGDPTTPYCIAKNAGKASEDAAVCRRIAELFASLNFLAICDGTILSDARRMRDRMIAGLEADGYVLTYGDDDRMKVYPPGSRTGARKRREREARLT